MKLRHKGTGEIRPAEAREDGIYLYDGITEQWYKYDLDLLAKWWEYYEEPKEYWHIFGTNVTHTQKGLDKFYDKMNKEIGNYFETKEEAEKAVEKLKAWKRLKDKGFKFTGFTHKDRGRLDELEIYCQLGERPEDIEDMEDVRLLFGGEE